MLRQYRTASNALVSSRFDCAIPCSGVFHVLNLGSSQSVKNSLAKIVTDIIRYSHITPVLESLH